ncbi:MAG: pantoate--beta-alanine ligase [Nitrospirae bacterium]|nr:pantoate--beta-alanine ligase [Nitrospirota bacterium]
MQLVKLLTDMQSLSRDFRAEGKTIGFVPTMGALHEGHLSLVRQAGKENDVVVVSIFVNPIQFGPKEDFERYPRDLNGDLNKLSSLKVDAVFIPETSDMYPKGFSTFIDAGSTGEKLCGISRPGHFRGVATVVAKLFNIVNPHRAYSGQKDFQQTVVIKKLVRELNLNIEIVVCPTIREPDGLAMSSRNSYLNPEERKAAAVLYKALEKGKSMILEGQYNTFMIKTEMERLLKAEPLAQIEYISIVDPESLEEVDTIKASVVLALAVKIGGVRLIDNLIVSPHLSLNPDKATSR